MRSYIARNTALFDFFNNLHGLVEVYADTTCTELTEDLTFYFLLNAPIDVPRVLDKLQEICGNTIKFYATDKSHSLMFYGKRIIWRDKKWYW